MEDPAAEELARRPTRLGAERQLRTRIREGRGRRVGTRRVFEWFTGISVSLHAQLVSRGLNFGIIMNLRDATMPRALGVLFGADDSLWRRALVGQLGFLHQLPIGPGFQPGQQGVRARTTVTFSVTNTRNITCA